MAKINFFALGGLDEHGKNMYVLEVNKDIIIFDSGTQKPPANLYGVKTLVADTSWLKQNRNRIKGIFLSNGQDDHIGAVPFLLRFIPGLDVYGSSITLAALKCLLNKNNMKYQAQFHEMNTSKKISVGQRTDVRCFRLTSQLPGHFAYVVDTEDGSVIYATNYVFATETMKAFANDMPKIPLITNKTLMLLTDSKQAKSSGFTTPKYRTYTMMAPWVRASKFKVFFATYDKDLYTIFEVIRLCKETGRPLAIIGDTTRELLTECTKKKLISLEGLKMIDQSEIKNFANSAVLITNDHETIYETIDSCGTGHIDGVDFTEKDILIVNCPPLPGSEGRQAEVMDKVSYTGIDIKVISHREKLLMAASQDDIKTMVGLTHPKIVVPIRGLYQALKGACDAATDAGVPNDKIVLLDNGDVLSIHNGIIQQKADYKLRLEEKYVEGMGVSDVGAVVLQERSQMASNGFIIVGLGIDRKTKKVVTSIDTQMRGVAFINEGNSEKVKELNEKIVKMVDQAADEKVDYGELKNKIRRNIKKFCMKFFDKDPVVLVALVEI